MILTITLNAAVDTTYRIDGFALDRVNRPWEWKTVAGGKGINVARVFRTLGGEAIATGFLGGDTGRFVQRALRSEGMDGRFVRTQDASRTCIAVVDPISLTQTEINEPGPTVTAAELSRLRRHVERLAREQEFSFVTLSGSVPPGVQASIYADLIDILRRSGQKPVLDASGEPLRLGAAARPWMIKPNIYELSMLLGTEDATDQKDSDIIEAACDLAGTGIEVVCVTRGSRSALCVRGDEQFQAVPPKVPFVSAVGSGDSFLAGFLRSLEMGQGLESALRLAVGAGTANAAGYGAGFCTREAIHQIAAKTQIEAV